LTRTLPILLTVLLMAGVSRAAPEADEPAETSAATTRPAVRAVAPEAGRLDENMRRLWRESIDAPGDVRPAESLKAAVERLRSTPLRGPAVARPVEPLPEVPATAPDMTPEPTTQPTEEAVWLARLRRMPLAGVADPIRLGDALYAAGHYETASTFYRVALSRQLTPESRAWARLQVGNCLRAADPAAAAAVYTQAIAEQPDSLWCEVAEAQKRLLEWRQLTRPQEFLASLRESEDRGGPTTRPATPASGQAAGK